MFHSCHFLLDHVQFTLIHGPNIPGSYARFFFTESDFTSITSHILWLHLFILSGFISPFFSSTILGTYQPGEFIFQGHILLPFHTVYGAVEARTLKWLAIPSPADHILSELSSMTCSSWGVLRGMARSFVELDKAVVCVIHLVIHTACGISPLGEGHQ